MSKEKPSIKQEIEALKINLALKEQSDREKNINYLGIDPGSFKIGLALVDSNGRILKQKTVLTENFESELFSFLEGEYYSSTVIIGDGTCSINIQAYLNKLLISIKSDLEVKQINEKNSTLEARKLYWEVNPRNWWRKLLPLGLQTPPVEIDGYAAVVLVRRYIRDKS